MKRHEAARLAEKAMMLGPWLERHPLIGYFALAYGISWGGIVIVLGSTDFDLANLRPLDTGVIFVLMLLGPSTSGLVMTAHLAGRAGLRQLWSSVARWQVVARWYAFALLTMPVILLAILWSLGAFLDPAFAPRFNWPLFAIGLVAGSFEEVGWTGYATPRLLARLRLFMAGLSLGLAWALWHTNVPTRPVDLGAKKPPPGHRPTVIRDTMSRFHMCLISQYKLLSSTCSIPYSALGEHAGYALCNWCGASPTTYRIGFEWRQENPSGNSVRLRARAG